MSSRARPRALLGISAAGAAGLAATAVAQRAGAFQHADRHTREFIDARRRPALKKVARVGSAAGKWVFQLPASLALGAWVARRRGLLAGAAVPAASIGSTVLQKTMKALFPRPRPRRARKEGKRDNSFPSGHAAAAVAVGGTSAYVALREFGAPAWAIVPGAALFPVLTSGAKLYDRRHFFSDIVGGLAGGLAVGGAACALYEAGRKRFPRG